MTKFAQPAGAPFKISPAMAAVSLVTLSCAALFLVARPNGAQNLPAAKSTAAGQRKATIVSKPTAEAPADDTADRQGLDFYSDNVRGGMFSQPVPPAPKPEVIVVKVPKKDPPVKPVVLPPINPFADWSYTGTVHMGDITMGLLENRLTKEGQYLKTGDNFMGAQVKSIDDQMVTLTNAGKPTMLAKADTIVVTPLDHDAVGKNPTPPGQPGQPGQAQNGQAPNAATALAGQFTAMGPNGQMISGDQAQRYTRRLDRGFNRGGGNNNGGGGGNNGGGGGGRRGGRGSNFGG